MKIFNWVHRRFLHKDDVGEDVKSEFIGTGKDKVALLENAAMDSVFDSWKEGLLAIGTLGFDPAAVFKDYMPVDDTDLYEEIRQKEVFVGDSGDEDDGGDQESEMEYPLVLKACKHGFYHDQKDYRLQCDEIVEQNDQEDAGVEDLADLNVYEVKKESKRERITLADLFWADSQNNLLKNKKLADEDHIKVHYHATESNKKHDANDYRVSFISKQQLTTDDYARPIKKINRLMKKMLKKKIHPDIENPKETARMKPIRLAGSIQNA